MDNKNKKINRQRRHGRIRATVFGTKEKLRISVFRSNRHIFVQFIDDSTGKTVLSSRVVAASKSKLKGNKTSKAADIGKILAEKAKELGVKEVVFDRGGYKYHGRVKSLAEGLRAGGLKF